MLRPLLAAAAGALILATTAVPANSAAPTAGSPARVDWAPCADHAGFDCATLTRPIDPGRAGGDTFGMALARHRATDPEHRIGVLVVNPGGPGMSGVDFAYGAQWTFSAEVLARFDIVGFDPRGVGLSQAVRCSTDLYFDGHAAHPADEAGFEELRAHNRKLDADCARHSGPVVDHVSTEEVVADIDALRQALGERSISYYGLSYGTVIGQRYAERHGDRVRAMLLDSVVDRGLDARGVVASAARAAADSYEQWKRWNVRTPSAPLHGQDVDAVWDGLMARAERGELLDPDGSDAPLTPYDLSANLTTAAYDPDWEGLSDWVRSLNEGGITPPGPDDDVTPPSGAPEGGKDTSLYAGAMGHITCADQNFRVRSYAEYAELTRLARQISPRTLGSVHGDGRVTSCVGLPEAVTPQRPGTMRTTVPTLLLNSRHDPATSLENATAVHRQQPRSTVLVTYEGAGHGVYDRDDCTRRVGDAYLVSLDVPRDGLSCPATPK
jgi:pimeloyl-ACP methyl ester carboxylesterase